MITIKSVRNDLAADGRLLVRVLFTLQSEDANEPDYEAVYEHFKADDYTAENHTFVQMLSCTREDTREHLSSLPFRRELQAAVANHLADSEVQF